MCKLEGQKRGWACQWEKKRMRDWKERETESCLWEQDDPFDSACPSLCFPHSLTWPELYPHHHIHKGLCLQTSPYLWFIAQWRAWCLLMVLPAAHGITSAFFTTKLHKICWPSPPFTQTLSALKTWLHRCNFLRTMETFHFSFDLLCLWVLSMLSIFCPLYILFLKKCISGCHLYVLSAACGNHQIARSLIMKNHLPMCCCHGNGHTCVHVQFCVHHSPILHKKRTYYP